VQHRAARDVGDPDADMAGVAEVGEIDGVARDRPIDRDQPNAPAQLVRARAWPSRVGGEDQDGRSRPNRTRWTWRRKNQQLKARGPSPSWA